MLSTAMMSGAWSAVAPRLSINSGSARVPAASAGSAQCWHPGMGRASVRVHALCPCPDPTRARRLRLLAWPRSQSRRAGRRGCRRPGLPRGHCRNLWLGRPGQATAPCLQAAPGSDSHLARHPLVGTGPAVSMLTEPPLPCQRSRPARPRGLRAERELARCSSFEHASLRSGKFAPAL
jgi:hypothetical protein